MGRAAALLPSYKPMLPPLPPLPSSPHQGLQAVVAAMAFAVRWTHGVFPVTQKGESEIFGKADLLPVSMRCPGSLVAMVPALLSYLWGHHPKNPDIIAKVFSLVLLTGEFITLFLAWGESCHPPAPSPSHRVGLHFPEHSRAIPTFVKYGCSFCSFYSMQNTLHLLFLSPLSLSLTHTMIKSYNYS